MTRKCGKKELGKTTSRLKSKGEKRAPRHQQKHSFKIGAIPLLHRRQEKRAIPEDSSSDDEEISVRKQVETDKLCPNFMSGTKIAQN